ncbi:monofunctional biosynthetic peptidoglycan transglycosylase [Balneolaceae bacterium YR4-1]|uniref:Biosynthetic peptidoglycan transglycosylase n=1 Tax=Halalkalibaculum roseum TaxID=2709311 RepID=A0A6M1SLV2_9BACT|nr:monofunctional biosynthetic peptidoglycan transglycosylase [Halalkalibaculum roseum]NGP76311.1 monofunctional biosynthetic peptidoglycan transglycosylase [Halalkalibaculum roseum]
MEPVEKPNQKSLFKRIARLLTGFLIALLCLSFVSVLLLKWIHPPTSAFMLQRQQEMYWNDNQDPEINYEWADWEEISPYIKVAAITSEDQRFAEHWGLDLDAIEKAIDEHQRGESLRGASTITQQTAKNLFLWPGQSFIRKGIEAYLSVLMEALLSKKRILEIYLNIAEFGDGVYGVKAASKIYFNSDPANLDMIQSALLVTALPSPRRYNLANPSAYMIERRNWILQYMFYLGNTDYLKKLE